jgi:hypothetical protein
MGQRLFIWRVVIVILLASVGAYSAQAQKAQAPPISKAAYWMSIEPAVEVYLVEKDYGNFRLTVVSKKDLKVSYHTSINSYEPVDKELIPVSSTDGIIRSYEFRHTFTKMTIWMALEFTLDGKSIPELTRTFSNDIHSVVPNGYFHYGPVKKP